MSKSLGKRKEREGEGETQETEQKARGSTLFVSNLPYSATTTDLKTLFSDIGPVRTAFVVLEHGTGTSKGVGYVSFAIREDAQLAFDKVNESAEGIMLDGRRLRVQWAGSKPHKDERQNGESPVKKEPKPAKVPKVKEPSGPRDPDAIRTIVIAGLPAGIDAKALWKKVRKYAGAERVDWPAAAIGGPAEDPTVAHAVFATPAAAQDAVTKLHAHVFKGALLSVTLKKRLEGLARAPRPAAPTADGKKDKGPAPSRASRLIVRNLPFDVTEQDLRAVFLPYGPIYSIHIPMTEAEPKDEETGEAPQRRAKGYAFVWMLSKKDAEKALEGANGTKVHAGMADGLVRDKQKKKKLRREEAKIKQKEKERKAKRKAEGAEGEDEEEEDAEESEDEEAEAQERVIAVDWALSKDKWEEVKAKLQEEEQAEEEGDGDGEVKEDEDGEVASESGDEDDSHVGLHEGSDDESDSQPSGSDDDDEMSVDEEESKPGRPQLPPPEVGTTLFVRNVPFEATEDDLRTVFRAFGPLRYAKVAYDHETGRSRGTGFVCFWNKEHADKVIEQSEILRKETLGTEASTQPKKNPFKLPSLLTPDPSASIAQSLVLQGRTLDVIRAVTREEAGKLKEAGERQREKADKRNLYLLREGIILPNTPAAEGLPQAEVEKRTQSFGARKALLRSNPSLYVSRTRLSIRQLPLFATERMLKRLAIHAVRAFEAEVKSGARNALTEDELAEPAADSEDAPPATDPGKDKGKGKARADKKGRSTGVKQAKIVRQQDRVDPVTGKGRSKGYGFLEMEKHADALRVLRWANNNPKVGKLFEEWWKEELEDLVKIEKKKEKKEEGRLERLKAELEEGTAKRAKGTLIVEFSIENVQVVKRRTAHQQEQRSAPGETKKGNRRLSLPNVKKEEGEKDAHPRKKRRVSDPSPPSVKSEKTGKSGSKPGSKPENKPENKLGSLIGRKRKERKTKRKS